jgi:hypothetical protein
MIEEKWAQEFQYLYSDDTEIVCLYLNIIYEKYGKDVLIDYFKAKEDMDRLFYAYGDPTTNTLIAISTNFKPTFYFLFENNRFISRSEQLKNNKNLII